MATNILDNIDLRQLGEHLQQARKQRGMTQADAAKLINASRTTMVAIEKGDRRLKPSELIKLARAYGQSVSDFVRQHPIIENQHSAIDALDQGLITQGQFAKFLGVNRLDTRYIAESLRCE